jgi:hypothetical protein
MPAFLQNDLGDVVSLQSGSDKTLNQLCPIPAVRGHQKDCDKAVKRGAEVEGQK